MDLKIIILSEISQAQKKRISRSHSYINSKTSDLIEVESGIVVSRGWG
jgi:hypothetical protein